MHEFSLAQNIVEMATEQVQSRGASKVEMIDIEIGTLSGVVKEALEFALEEAKRHSVMEEATINLLEIQAMGKCKSCRHTFDLDDFFAVCPQCQSVDYEITSGKELKIKSLRIDS